MEEGWRLPVQSCSGAPTARRLQATSRVKEIRDEKKSTGGSEAKLVRRVVRDGGRED